MSAPEQKDIRQKLDKVAEKVRKDPAFGRLLSYKAVRAILGGINSAQWEDYMKEIIGKNAPNQLKRLMLKDDHAGIEKVRESCAYIIGNGVCGTETTTVTRLNVDDLIDNNLAPEPVDPDTP